MLSFKKKAILLGLEPAYGQGLALSGASHAIQALDLTITPMEGEELQREIAQPFLGGKPKLLVGTHVSVEFGLELAGSGTPGMVPAFGAVLRACGLAETIITGPNTIGSTLTAVGNPTGTWTVTPGTPYAGPTDRTVTLDCTGAGGSGVAVVRVSAPANADYGLEAYEQDGIVLTDATPLPLPGGATILPTITAALAVGDKWTVALYAPRVEYEPVSEGFESATIGYYLDGVYHGLLGARGSVSLDITAKKFPVLKCQFKGLYVPPEAQALPAVDYSRFLAPVVVSTKHTTRFKMHGYSGPLESLALTLNNSVEARFLVGLESITITDREPSGSIKLDAPALASKNFFAAAMAGELAPLHLQHGTSPGNIVEIDCPRVQLLAPKYGESQGIAQLEMNLEPKPNAGDDEIKFTFR